MIRELVTTKRLLVVLGPLLAAGGLAVTLLPLHRSSGSTSAPPTAVASRGDVVLSVGGVGRVVEARSTGTIAVPAATPTAPGASPTPAAPTTASADSVFPRAAGRLAAFLVAPGQQVSAGEPIAIVDDGSASATALAQARGDVAAAQLELRQKQTSDPAKGLPPTPAELRAARSGLVAARERARLVMHPTTVDVTAAQLDARKAQSDLATLLRAQGPKALAAARFAVGAATGRLFQAAVPASPVDLAAARSELAKAQADLDTLKATPPGPGVVALHAAQLAVTLAEQRLAELPPGATQSEILAAQLDLKKAQAELEALRRPAPVALASALAAAQAAIDLATQKLAVATGPPNPATVASAGVDLRKAQAELETLRRAAPPAAVEAAQLAIVLSRDRLTQLRHPTTATRDTGAADVAKAASDLATLLHRGAPAGALDIGIARLKIQAADARIATAQLQADRLTVRAPFSGTVTALLTAPNAPADPSTPVATIADLSHLAVSVDLSEFDVAKVHQGARALLAVDALGGRRLPGRVSFVAFAGVDNGGVVNFPVRVALLRSGAVKPGMNVSVRIVVAERRHAIRVPLEALHGGTVTVVGPRGVTVERQVVRGLADNKQVEIKRGLRTGERVLLAPKRA